MLKKFISVLAIVFCFNLLLGSCQKETMNSIIENGKFLFFFKNDKALTYVGVTSDYRNYYKTYLTFKIKDQSKNVIFQTTELISVYQEKSSGAIFYSSSIDYAFSSLSDTQRENLTKRLSNPSETFNVEITASSVNGGVSTSTWSLYDNASSCFEYDSSNYSVSYIDGCLIKILLE